MDILARQEADRTYEDIMTTVSSVRARGTGRQNTGKGIADTQLVYDRTRSGKKMTVVSDCPRSAFTVKIENIDQRTCSYLMEKTWKEPFKPLGFFRAEGFDTVCEEGVLETTDGYYMMQGSDCTKAGAPETGGVALAFDLRGRAQKIRPCHNQKDCLDCQTCNTTKQLCEDNCEGEEICSTDTQECVSPITCKENQYEEAGVCRDCPSQTSCDANHAYDSNGCEITYAACGSNEYCDGAKCISCPTPVTTICAGTPTADVNGCPEQNFQICATGVCKDNTTCVDCLNDADCSGTTPLCDTENNTCYCPENAECDKDKMEDPTNIFECNEGYYQFGNECLPNICDGYSLTSCPTGGNCSECLSGTSIKYRLKSCQDGYEMKGNTCVAADCSLWSVMTPITGCVDDYQTTCRTPTTTYYKCSECEAGYYLSDDICFICDEAEYPVRTQCTGESETYANGCPKVIINQCEAGNVCNVENECVTCPSGMTTVTVATEGECANRCEGAVELLNEEGTYTCAYCPQNSSLTVIEGNQLADSLCYCNAGYYVDTENNTCSEAQYCGYTFSETLEADCYVTIDSGMQSDCSVTFSSGTDVTASGTTTCGSGKYCAVFWASNSLTGLQSTLTNSSGGTLYGKCQPFSMNEATVEINVTAGKRCGPGQYCALFWTSDSLTGPRPTLGTSSGGTLYGKCQSSSMNVPAVPVPYSVLLNRKQCAEGEYCQITNTGSDGEVYGTCTTIN